MAIIANWFLLTCQKYKQMIVLNKLTNDMKMLCPQRELDETCLILNNVENHWSCLQSDLITSV